MQYRYSCRILTENIDVGTKPNPRILPIFEEANVWDLAWIVKITVEKQLSKVKCCQFIIKCVSLMLTESHANYMRLGSSDPACFKNKGR